MISASGSARRAAHRLLQINFILPLVQVPLVSYAVYLSNSIVILADALGVYINVLQMGLVWIVHRYGAGADGQRQARFQFGFGKLENLSVLVVCVFETAITLLVLSVAIEALRTPEPLRGAGVGMAVLVAATVVHAAVYVAYREQFRTSDSPIVRSFKALIPIYILNNLVVLSPILLGTFSGLQAFALYADPVGAFVLVAFSWVMIYGLATRSVTCLIDRAVDEEVQLLIMRMLAEHFDRFDTVHDIRTRAVGDRVHVEIDMGFDPAMPVAALEDVIRSMAARVEDLVPKSRLLVSPVPVLGPAAA